MSTWCTWVFLDSASCFETRLSYFGATLVDEVVLSSWAALQSDKIRAMRVLRLRANPWRYRLIIDCYSQDSKGRRAERSLWSFFLDLDVRHRPHPIDVAKSRQSVTSVYLYQKGKFPMPPECIHWGYRALRALVQAWPMRTSLFSSEANLSHHYSWNLEQKHLNSLERSTWTAIAVHCPITLRVRPMCRLT